MRLISSDLVSDTIKVILEKMVMVITNKITTAGNERAFGVVTFQNGLLAMALTFSAIKHSSRKARVFHYHPKRFQNQKIIQEKRKELSSKFWRESVKFKNGK